MKNTALFVSLALVCTAACSRPSTRKPVAVTFLDLEWDVQDRLPALGQDLQDFTRETGIQIKRLPGPDGSLNQLALWKSLLQKGRGGPDVCNVDAIWSAILDPYLTDLKPYFSSGVASMDPVVVGSYTVGNRLVAMPHHAYVGVLFYRADLLHRYGFSRPPATWDELEKMAARIQAGERAKGEKDFWGYVWEGAEGEDLTCGGLEWQVSEGGGRIIEDDRTVSVSNPRAIRCWQRAARWVGSISPPGVVAYGKWDAENVWSSGKAAFLRSWASDFSIINVQTPPLHASQFGITGMPGGSAGRVGALGGNALAVPRNSAHPKEALEMIRYLGQRDVELKRAREPLEPSKQMELFELPNILAPYPKLSKSGLPGGRVVARPSIVAGLKYEDVTRAYFRTVHAVLTGEIKATAAAAALEKELVAITGYKPGPPSN